MTNAGRTVTAALGATLALTALASPASAATSAVPDNPPPGSVTVTVERINGTGCPAGTVTATNDVDTFTVGYFYHRAVAGGNYPPAEVRANCQVELKIVHPPEFTYGIIGGDHQGYAVLERGASGLLKTRVAYPGVPQGKGGDFTIQGPFADEWEHNDGGGLPDVISKPCNRDGNITVSTELRIDVGTSDKSKVSFMEMSSLSGDRGSIYRLAWKRCP